MAGAGKRTRYWLIWGGITLAIGGYLTFGMLRSDTGLHPLLAPARSLLMPGGTTHGHYQIELACESCHTRPFASAEDFQAACESCHGDALKEAVDKHPLSKFTDPRNAPLLSRIDATRCVTCHAEHRPEITTAMGVTQPVDLCRHCHADIAKERPSHAGMGFETCSSGGCHNFHDNQALYEDFLLKHLNQPEHHAGDRRPEFDFLELGTMLPSYPSERYPVTELGTGDIDAPAGHLGPAQVTEDWLASSHARAGVNCSACHQPIVEEVETAWTDHPDQRACAGCHEFQVEGFVTGLHGMRIAAGLGPMEVANARLPMQESAHGKAIGCTSCHGAHGFETAKATADACLGCHADEHSLAWRESPHGRLSQATGKDADDAVTCATCHMPRVRRRDSAFDLSWTAVQHNQSDTLHPNEKMIRPVCLGCHGLGFAIDALADPELVRNNFTGKPARHIPSLDMAEARLREYEAQRATGRNSDNP